MIGYSDCTGHCFGAHLHFEVRINGEVTDPMALPVAHEPRRPYPKSLENPIIGYVPGIFPWRPWVAGDHGGGADDSPGPYISRWRRFGHGADRGGGRHLRHARFAAGAEGLAARRHRWRRRQRGGLAPAQPAARDRKAPRVPAPLPAGQPQERTATGGQRTGRPHGGASLAGSVRGCGRRPRRRRRRLPAGDAPSSSRPCGSAPARHSGGGSGGRAPAASGGSTGGGSGAVHLRRRHRGGQRNRLRGRSSDRRRAGRAPASPKSPKKPSTASPGPESPVGKTVDKVVETVGGLLGGGK